MKKFINYLLCLGLAFTMIGCSSSSESTTSKTSSKETSEKKKEEVKEASEDFKELIAPFGLEDVDISFSTKSNVAVYGHLLDEISLEILGFASDSDIVTEMENIIYYNISGLTDEEINNLKTNVENLVETFKSLSNCTAECGLQGDSLYVLSLKYTDMDNKENLQAVIDAGGLSLEDSSSEISYLGYTVSCDNLKDNGWTER